MLDLVTSCNSFLEHYFRLSARLTLILQPAIFVLLVVSKYCAKCVIYCPMMLLSSLKYGNSVFNNVATILHSWHSNN